MKLFPELREAMLNLTFNYPFWAMLLYTKVPPRITDDIPTLAVSLSETLINKDYFLSLERMSYRVAALAHEVTHAMLFHPARMAEYLMNGIRGEPFDIKRFNIAADFVINAWLRHCGFSLHESWLYSPDVDWQESVEDVYFRLKPPPEQGPGSGKDDGDGGKETWELGPAGRPDMPGEQFELPAGGSGSQDVHQPATEQPGEALEWKAAVEGAAMSAKAQGKLPAGIQRFVERYVEPKKPWKEIFRDFITSHAGYDQRNPHRFNQHKARTMGVLLNKRKSEVMGKVSITIDTSGSIGSSELSTFMGACVEILSECRPEEIIVLGVDYEVNNHAIVRDPYELEQFQPKGGGGTDMEATYKWLEENGHDDVEIAIILTDGWTSFTEEPHYPVVWVSTDKPEEDFPYGNYVKLDIEE